MRVGTEDFSRITGRRSEQSANDSGGNEKPREVETFYERDTQHEQEHTPVEVAEQHAVPAASETASAAAVPADKKPVWESIGAPEKLQQARQASRQYWRYLSNVLPFPLRNLNRVGEEHLVNSLISLALVVLLFPVIYWVTMLRLGTGVDFADLVLQPFLFAVMTVGLAIGGIYGVVMLKGVKADLKTLIVQFGTATAPVVVVLVLALLLSLIGIWYNLVFALIVLSAVFIIVAANLVAWSYAQVKEPRLDTMYSHAALTVVVGYGLYLLIKGSIALHLLFYAFNRLLSGF